MLPSPPTLALFSVSSLSFLANPLSSPPCPPLPPYICVPAVLALLSVSMGTARLVMEWIGWRTPCAMLTTPSLGCRSWWDWVHGCLIIHKVSAMSSPASQTTTALLYLSPLWPSFSVVQVYDSTSSLNQTVDDSLQQLEEQYAEHADYLSIVQKLQGQLEELARQMVEIPFWGNANISLDELAIKIELYDWYR